MFTQTAAPRPGSEAREAAPETTVLVVDDSLVDRRLAGRFVDQHAGWKAVLARNGAEALTILERSLPRLVVTDLQMPELDGLALLERIRAKYPQVPVVLMTGSGSEELASRALSAGAASYVPKRNLSTHLQSVLEQVLSASQLDVYRRRMLECLTQRDSRFALENDPALIPPLVALLQEDLLAMHLCDATGATRVGVALQEAMLNALYHGNLELSNAGAPGDEEFQRLVEQRRQQAPYRDRRIRLFANVTRTEAAYVIMDQGPGFDPSTLPEKVDPAALDKSSGRGIVLMRAFMDRVNFTRTGNQVTLIKLRETPSNNAT